MELAAFIVGSLALAISIMALPTVFQMFWGRPSIKVDFDEFHDEGKKTLLVKIRNEAIKSKFLRIIGVYRQSAEVSAGYEIFEKGTNKQILPLTRALIHNYNGERRLFVALAISLPVQFRVIECAQDGIGAVLRDGISKQTVLPGLYYVKALVTSGDDAYTFQRDLQIGANQHETRWRS